MCGQFNIHGRLSALGIEKRALSFAVSILRCPLPDITDKYYRYEPSSGSAIPHCLWHFVVEAPLEGRLWTKSNEPTRHILLTSEPDHKCFHRSALISPNIAASFPSTTTSLLNNHSTHKTMTLREYFNIFSSRNRRSTNATSATDVENSTDVQWLQHRVGLLERQNRLYKCQERHLKRDNENMAVALSAKEKCVTDLSKKTERMKTRFGQLLVELVDLRQENRRLLEHLNACNDDRIKFEVEKSGLDQEILRLKADASHNSHRLNQMEKQLAFFENRFLPIPKTTNIECTCEKSLQLNSSKNNAQEVVDFRIKRNGINQKKKSSTTSNLSVHWISCMILTVFLFFVMPNSIGCGPSRFFNSYLESGILFDDQRFEPLYGRCACLSTDNESVLKNVYLATGAMNGYELPIRNWTDNVNDDWVLDGNEEEDTAIGDDGLVHPERDSPIPNHMYPEWLHDLPATSRRSCGMNQGSGRREAAEMSNDPTAFRAGNPMIDPVYWCNYDHEHGSYPGPHYRPALAYMAWKTPDESTETGRQSETREGCKVLRFQSSDGRMVVLTVDMHISRARRFLTRHHTVVSVVVESGKVTVELSFKSDFGPDLGRARGGPVNLNAALVAIEREVKNVRSILALRKFIVLNITTDYHASLNRSRRTEEGGLTTRWVYRLRGGVQNCGLVRRHSTKDHSWSACVTHLLLQGDIPGTWIKICVWWTGFLSFGFCSFIRKAFT